METAIDRSVTNDLVKRIRKLRWMGMEEEAKRLQAELAGPLEKGIARKKENSRRATNE